MAAPTRTETLNNLYTSTWAARRTTVEDAWSGANPVFYKLTQSGNVENQSGGRYIECPLEYASNSTVTALDRGGTVSLAAQELYTTVYFDWKYYAVNVTRYHTDDQKNTGEEMIFRRMDRDLKNAKNSVIEEIETRLFTAQTGLHILGFQDIIAEDPTASSTTVGNIDQASYTWWRNQYLDMTAFAFAVYGRQKMTNFYNTIIANGGKPNLLISDQATYELYDEECFEIQRAYIDDKGLKDIGMGDFAFKGQPWTWSRRAPSGSTFFLDMRKFYLYRDSREWFKMTRWKDIPNQPEDYVAQILMTLELCCSNRKHQGVMFNQA